jgi:hypothetical protein
MQLGSDGSDSLAIWPDSQPGSGQSFFSVYGGAIAPPGDSGQGGAIQDNAQLNLANTIWYGDFNGVGSYGAQVEVQANFSGAASVQVFSSANTGFAEIQLLGTGPTWGLLTLNADTSGLTAHTEAVHVSKGATVTASIDYDGRITCAGSLGIWGHAAPASQPATAVTLADVIAILQTYGLCA